jgi:3-oxoacyl-[acyl-carrier protein] reductase
MDLELRGKRAFVSGSSSGIGKAIAIELANEGCDVVVHGRDRARTDETAREVESIGVRTRSTYGDLGDEAVAAQVAKDTLELLGTVDICVNNVGAVLQMHNPDWLEIPSEEWVRSYRVNFMSGLHMAQHFAPGMKEQKWGRIIDISSTAGTHTDGFLPDYGAAKAGVNNRLANLSKLLGQYGITINAVIPGTILTPAVDRWLAELKKQLDWGDDFAENERIYTTEITPQSVPRLGQPREIAVAVAWLASPLAGYINGTGLRVDGGSAHFF